MCKLVEDPAEVLPLMPRLEPLVKAATEKISDPEARGMAERAYNTLQKAGGKGAEEVKTVEAADVAKTLLSTLGADANEVVTAHVAGLAAAATNLRIFDAGVWRDDVGYAPFDAVIDAVRAKLEVALSPEEEFEVEDLDGVDLYKGNFSLAYGTLTLLRDAKMHLKQNRFYGLLGPNQCGKTTLMRAIVTEKLEGFPKQDELKSVFVEHEIE
jgi:elongation factor 3